MHVVSRSDDTSYTKVGVEIGNSNIGVSRSYGRVLRGLVEGASLHTAVILRVTKLAAVLVGALRDV